MDENEDQILKKFNKYQLLKRTSQFVFSVSVFSFFFWYTSGFSLHPQSFNNAYFSTCLFSMFTHTLERKYMFLICNGILAFIAKTSLMNPSPPTSAFDLEFNEESLNLSEINNAPVFVPFRSSEFQETVPLMVEKQVLNEEVLDAAEEQEDETLYTLTEGKDNESYIEETESEVEYDEVEDTTMKINEELINTDELNRKFEEFIRKMKEEIRIEAQRQLIAV
ncbi:hypothetical protein TanjilG_27165 [Lupinus angustifolius]|uniref:DUF4408 domain-containing protein n=1 Tax=Lupinus angustifolius TaxID=3871 RepID=A0A394B9Z6_LUPAN|nr:PREDICTED: uncharacterized protein LOC109329201 [Lupinus angustifolius]XP_019418779.1 PREDICTED: uncharacterized protein LOC109329541 [Lupinus angustifolius]OIV96060.1 hypothetical protein TanjilG_27164 [Lupinus angustifolius]OIV96061.1 hypothetical protein TanjilG_27165 [Lupinus angustifolius]